MIAFLSGYCIGMATVIAAIATGLALRDRQPPIQADIVNQLRNRGQL